MILRPFLSSCNYAESQDSLVTTTLDSTSHAVTDLKARLVGSFPLHICEGLGVLASVCYLWFCRCS